MSKVPSLKFKISRKRSVLELWHVFFESQYCLTHKRIFVLWRLKWVSFKTFHRRVCYVWCTWFFFNIKHIIVVGPDKLMMTLFRAHRVELNLIGTYAMKTSEKRREEDEMETKKKHRFMRVVEPDIYASADCDGFVEIRCELNANRYFRVVCALNIHAACTTIKSQDVWRSIQNRLQH